MGWRRRIFICVSAYLLICPSCRPSPSLARRTCVGMATEGIYQITDGFIHGMGMCTPSKSGVPSHVCIAKEARTAGRRKAHYI